MEKFEKVNHRLLGEHVEAQLKEYILTTPVNIGDKIPTEFELADMFGVQFPENRFAKALTIVADNRRFNPLRDYIKSLPEWDEVPRVDTLLVDYLGAEDTPYTRAVTRATLIGAVSPQGADFSEPVTEDLTLYAGWSYAAAAISLSADRDTIYAGGTVDEALVTVTPEPEDKEIGEFTVTVSGEGEVDQGFFVEAGGRVPSGLRPSGREAPADGDHLRDDELDDGVPPRRDGEPAILAGAC